MGLVLGHHYLDFDQVYTKENYNIYNSISTNVTRSTTTYIFIVKLFDMAGVNIILYEFNQT